MSDNHNEAIFREIQQAINNLTQRRSQVERDIETSQVSLEAMKKELGSLDDSLTRNQGGLSLLWVINNSNYVVTDNPGDKIELGQPQIALNNAVNQQPPQAAQQYTSQPAVAPAVGEQPITQQAQTQFAPPPQYQQMPKIDISE